MHPAGLVKNLGIWFDATLMLVSLFLFGEYGDMRKIPKNILLKELAYAASNSVVPVDLEIVDGKGTLSDRNWPKIGTVQHFSQSFCWALPKPHFRYVVFDKYVSGKQTHSRFSTITSRHHNEKCLQLEAVNQCSM